MCGITGGYNVGKEMVEKMLIATAHRGPDATGVSQSGSVVFGHNRLAIIDTSSRSNQPMQSPDGRYMLVFNGEIYNFKELRKSLPNWHFKSEGDSEVLLAALCNWGVAALDRLQGIFAFAFYDKKADELILVRDHMGVKPLYYKQESESLFFSSELSGVITAIPSPTIDQDALAQYMAYNYVPSPYTLVSGVSKVPPGHWVKFSHTSLEIQRYFNPITPSGSISTGAMIRDNISEEVGAQLVSDRPIGVLLSGGFDSSIVLHHASERQTMKTFSTGFEMSKGSESEFNKFNADATLAKRTASYYGSSHHEFLISLDMIRNELISGIEMLDEPIANPVQISQLLLAQFVREQGVVVALGGDGGDELWGGYDRHRAVLAAQYYHHVPKILRLMLDEINPHFKKMGQSLGADIHLDLTTLDQEGADRMFRKSLQRDKLDKVVRDRYMSSEIRALAPIDAFMRADRELWLADDALQRTDRSGMAYGVEIRVPLLGMPIVNFTDSIRGSKKFTPLSGKSLLKKTYKNHLPNHLYNQPKRGWMAPGAKWLRDKEIEKTVRSVLSNDYYDGLSAMVDWNEVQIMLTEHISAERYYLNPLWNIMVLQIWAKKFNVRL